MQGGGALFYPCTVAGCNKKYKTVAKFKEHVLLSHQQVVEHVPNLCKVFKDPNKAMKLEAARKEAEHKERILEFEYKCRQNALANAESCSICFERPRDTAPMPCGHLFFCFQCIYPMKTCPICRADIASLSKIYQ